MNTRRKSKQEWSQVRAELVPRGPGATTTIPKASFPHPLDAGARRTATWPVGQVADYTIPGPTGMAPVVVREFDHQFVAAIEGAQLAIRAAQAAEQNPRAAMYLGGALLGGAVATSVSNRKESALVGAGLGLLFAAMLEAALDDRRRR